MSDEQIVNAIVEGICYPTYKFTSYHIKNSSNKGYRIYKRLIKLKLIYKKRDTKHFMY